MKRLDHWFVCLDLSRMDDILVGYTNFLSTVIKPKTISFLHVVESSAVAREMVELFPELETRDDFDAAIRKELREKIDEHFDDSSIETRLIIKEGRPTDQIIELMNSMDPDLLIMGKKTGYAGEGVIARRLVKYVPSSILFVPETSRYSLKKALVPVDFSDQSAHALSVAKQLTETGKGSITAQHIYKYPSQFFPYMPSDKEKERITTHLKEKKEEFFKTHNLAGSVEFVFSLHKDGRIADNVYDQAVHDQADLIVVAAKSNKKITSIFRDDFTDKMTYYSFGIPLLVYKNKERHQRFLKRLFTPDK